MSLDDIDVRMRWRKQAHSAASVSGCQPRALRWRATPPSATRSHPSHRLPLAPSPSASSPFIKKKAICAGIDFDGDGGVPQGACAGCRKAIAELDELVTIGDKKFHDACWVCSACKKVCTAKCVDSGVESGH